jgi:hypothetical protein
MPDYAGPLQRLVLSRTLWLILVWPAVGAAWQLIVERRRDADSARRVSIASLALATAATVAHVVILAQLPAGRRALLEPLGAGARIGQLDLSLALWFDPLAAAAAVLACVVALAAALVASRRAAHEHGWRVWAWIHLALEAALVSFLADGFVATAIGWSVASLTMAWLAGWADPRAARLVATRSAIAISALTIGAVLVFWGMGGSWEGDEFVPDAQPRFVAARIGSESAPLPPAPHAASADGSTVELRAPERATERPPGGAVTSTSGAGALVFVDDARGGALVSPFVGVPVQGGSHGFRIHRGGATEDAVVPRVAFEGGDEIALVQLGPTLVFRDIADALLLRDRRSEPVVRRALEARQAPGGLPLAMAVWLGWLVAAAAMSGSAPPPGAPTLLVAVSCGGAPALLGPYFLARVTCLAPLAPHTSIATAFLGGTILLGGAVRARRLSGAVPRLLAFVAAAPAGGSFIALGAGGAGAFLEAMMATAFAAAGLHLVASRRADWGDTKVPIRQEASLVDALCVGTPERIGEWFASMDRWVVDAVVGAAAAAARAGAWMVATADAHLVSTPANVLALRLTRVVRRVDPVVGGSISRILWGLLGALAVAALLHALWPAR